MNNSTKPLRGQTDNEANLKVALDALTLGLSPVPPTENGTKAPLADIPDGVDEKGKPKTTWKPYSDTPATEEHVRQWYAAGMTGNGLAAGYGKLECFEFDCRDTYDDFLDLASEAGLGELVNRIRTGYEEFTPSGGVHWLYRADRPLPSTKLAQKPAPTEKDPRARKTLIETKGIGGFIIIAPTWGKVHQTGKPYVLVSGSLGVMTTVFADEQEALFSFARSFDQIPVAVNSGFKSSPRKAKSQGDGSITPLDDFNARADWAKILSGWVKVYDRGGATKLRRPGKTIGISASLKDDVLYVYTTSTELEAAQSYTKAGAYCLLEHKGDWTKCVKALVVQTYGTWIDDGGQEHQNPRPAAPKQKIDPKKWQPSAAKELISEAKKTTSTGQPVDDAALAKFQCTDLGNAERLVARHGADLRYCHPWKKWLAWDGTRWATDSTAVVTRKAKQTVRRMYAEALTLATEDDQKELIKWAHFSEQKKLIDSMIGLASSEQGIPVEPKDLNLNSWLLNCPNGTVNLKTGKLQQHDRADLITVLCPVQFDEHALCPIWDASLERIFDRNQALIAFWRRLCGLALTGDVSEQILPICWGIGANGKSTLLKALIDMFGPDYAGITAAGLLTIKRSDSHPTERADLYGKRLMVDMESAEDARLNETYVKQLTGSDRLKARRMREDFWEFEPTQKLIMCTNHRPAIRETKNAIWRRVQLIPFSVVIPENEWDKKLPAKLAREFPGILAWAVRGCLEWQGEGLQVPEIVRAATSEYREEENALKSFILEQCLTGEGTTRTRAGELYSRFRSYVERSGETSITQKAFGIAMAEAGYEKDRSNGIWYQGINLRHEWVTEANGVSSNGNRT